MAMPAGYRFNPLDRELINFYLKPLILREQLPCDIIKFREVYGPSSDPWTVFDRNDQSSWFTSPDIKDTEKFMFAFTKLSKLSRSNSATSKNTSKKAGFGTWVGKTQDQIVDGDNVIGEKRYLVFEIKDIDSVDGVGFDLSQAGSYRMHEYSLSGVNAGLNSADNIVLCKITYDSAKGCQITKTSGAKSGGKFQKKKESIKNLEGSGSVTAEDLNVIDSGGGGDNLDERRTSSLAVMNSDVGDWCAAPQDNNGVQGVDDFEYDFTFYDDLAGYDLSLDDDQGGFDTDWMTACQDSNQEQELLEDSMTSMLGKRKFELEDNLYQAKKMCLE